jgi:hypothetical protein
MIETCTDQSIKAQEHNRLEQLISEVTRVTNHLQEKN